MILSVNLSLKIPFKRLLLLSGLCFAALSKPLFVVSEESRLSSPSAIEQIYDRLQNLTFDVNHTARVQNVTIQKDRARFTLEDGTIYFSTEIGGKITAAVFLGKGVFRLTPPTEIERAQVFRFLEKDSIDQPFTAGYFRFTDETAQRLMHDLAMTPAPVPGRVEKMHEKIVGLLLEKRHYNLTSRILSDLVNEVDQGFFFAVLEYPQPQLNFPGFVIFNYDPKLTEEVAAYQFLPHRAKKPFYTMCSFRRLIANEAANKFLLAKKPRPEAFQISHYKMDLDLQRNGKLQAACELTLQPARDSLRFLTFDLFYELKIDSVKNAAGDALSFFKEKQEAGFSVALNQPAVSGQENKITVFYSGKAMQPMGDHFYLKDKFNWYPRTGYLLPATYDLNFNYSKNWQVIATGNQVKYAEKAGDAAAHWVEQAPALAAAFAYGSFDSTVFDVGSPVPIRIYSTRQRTKSMRKKIAGDAANSLHIFQSLLGGYPYNHLNIVETAGTVSQGFPGLLFLSSLTFAREMAGVMEELRGHEVSHQWWGNLVGWQSYHDQWLSEGFAEYSGALITQFLLKDDTMFLRILEGWRNDLLKRGHIGVSAGLRRFGFSKSDLVRSQGMQAGPIWMGKRLGDKFPVDYYLITYEKSAYVMHMLRILLRDFETGSDEKFWAMWADFVKTFAGRRANSDEFKNVVEKHADQEMTWFWNQWIYGTEIPTFHCAYQIKTDPPEYVVEVQIRLEDVPANYKMFLPVAVQFENHSKQSQLLWLQETEQSFRLGPFEQTPKKVIFNDFAGVLAHIKLK